MLLRKFALLLTGLCVMLGLTGCVASYGGYYRTRYYYDDGCYYHYGYYEPAYTRVYVRVR